MNHIISAIVLALMLQGLGGPAKMAGTAKLAGAGASGCTLPFSDALTGSGTLGSNWTSIAASGYVAAARSGSGAVSSTGTGASIATATCATYPTLQSAQGVIVSGGGDATGLCVQVNNVGDAGACFIGLADVFSLGAGSGGPGFACPLTSPQVSGDTFKITSTGPTGTDTVTVTDVTRSTTVCTGATAGGTITGLKSAGFIVDQRTFTTDRISNIVVD